MIARKYLYLIALAREKHFGRAAEACHVSASTLSAAIRDIESELGVTVVERGQQFSGLTPEGERVLECARQLAARAEDLRQELAQMQDGLCGRLRLGVIPTGLTAVATLTAAFARRHPLVDIEVLSMSTQQILGGLRSFELDGGIAYLESTANDLAAVPLWCENHVLLTPRDGPFEGRDCVTWHEAARIPLCLLTANMHNRQTIDSVFASLGEQPRPTLETDSIVSILAHVSAGHWSSIVPRAVLDLIGIPTGTRVFELRDPLVEWATGLLVLNRQPRSPMVEALMGEARALNLGMQDSTRVT
ncbi:MULTISPECIES: LysR family transcriptional regulator [Zoogloea]|jgi:DNA-binding transcriptional LysR family regulator|uniref:LysR family transcriptional regulator n=1 Tax=Zoogloea oleivorans TaxID=1552750 RepID=A0A6C2CZU5_9RHOO|nr:MULTISPECIES: LysR family transcriptional regulator [Zoogloea]MDD2669749.1 LysR family transcriptional regulator [Zoogloea sp.]MDY0034500.1 LysR family transcriptional regulator [Zoogloea oleivorans]TYC59650.1 LysR family transcriptional regulator [Zoogloea oleivorans]